MGVCPPYGIIKPLTAVPEIQEPERITLHVAPIHTAPTHTTPPRAVVRKRSTDKCFVLLCMDGNSVITKSKATKQEAAKKEAEQRAAEEHAAAVAAAEHAQRVAYKRLIYEKALAICTTYQEELHKTMIASIEPNGPNIDRAVEQIKNGIDNYHTFPPDFQGKIKKMVVDASTQIKAIEATKMSCHIEDKDTESVEHARIAIDNHADTYYYEMVERTLEFWGVLKEVCCFNVNKFIIEKNRSCSNRLVASGGLDLS